MGKNKKRPRSEAGPSKTSPKSCDVGNVEPEGSCRNAPSSMPVLESLVAPMGTKEFFSKVWEESPRVFKNPFTRKTFAGKFDFDTVLSIADKLAADDMALAFGMDINAARYNDGVRETLNREVADKATLQSMFRKEGITLQFHQPQRFDDHLAALMAAMEAELGCLVGCNAYLTPKETQGLAPHHDDVELFVCQTQGSKRWRLYEPLDGFRLPSRPSGDLPEDVIGEPLMDVVLEEGDVLYMPRGIIHQAVAQDRGSTHLTISTYQRWTWGDLAATVLQGAGQSMQEPMCLPLPGRRSLPPGFLHQHSLEASSPQVPMQQQGDGDSIRSEHAATLAAFLREMADQVEAAPELLTMAADTMAMDLQRSRLAPDADSLPSKGPEPRTGSWISARCSKGTFRIVPSEDMEGLVLLHCLGNDRMAHMMPPGADQESDGEDSDEEGEQGSIESEDVEEEDGDGGDNGMLGPFDEDWMDAVVQVLNSHDPIPVSSLSAEGSEARLAVARFLWDCGAACCTASQPPAKLK